MIIFLFHFCFYYLFVNKMYNIAITKSKIKLKTLENPIGYCVKIITNDVISRTRKLKLKERQKVSLKHPLNTVKRVIVSNGYHKLDAIVKTASNVFLMYKLSNDSKCGITNPITDNVLKTNERI